MDEKTNNKSEEPSKTKKVNKPKHKNTNPNSGKATTKTSLINDGKCCRCSFRNSEKMCTCKKSKNNNKHVARKNGCENFKYSK